VSFFPSFYRELCSQVHRRSTFTIFFHLRRITVVLVPHLPPFSGLVFAMIILCVVISVLCPIVTSFRFYCHSFGNLPSSVAFPDSRPRRSLRWCPDRSRVYSHRPSWLGFVSCILCRIPRSAPRFCPESRYHSRVHRQPTSTFVHLPCHMAVLKRLSSLLFAVSSFGSPSRCTPSYIRCFCVCVVPRFWLLRLCAVPRVPNLAWSVAMGVFQ
jgi:hypothetical protein